MANRFWVGGGSANTWAATGNTNWSATSGGANNASVPGTGDVAIFDGGSGTGNSVIGASITVQGLDCTGGTGNYAGTITHNTAVTLTINTGAASSLRFTAGMTYTPATTSSLITFSNTSGTAQITSAGKVFNAITVNGVGGTVQQLDNLLINGVQNAILTITNGIFDCNGFSLTAILISSSNSNIRSFLLGSGVTIGGNISNAQSIWDFGTATNLTFTKNSANITALAPSGAIIGTNFKNNNLTLNTLTFNSTTNNVDCYISNGFTCAQWNVGPGWQFQVTNAQTITSTTAFAWTGTAANPIIVSSTVNTAICTISCPSGACSLTWGAMQNVTASGGATFTATNSFSFGTNAGWSISPPADATTVAPTAAQVATVVWQDTTAGDFTVSGSIGKSLFTSGNAPGAASGIALVGSNMGTVTSVSGAVGSVTGAVGSVTGNIGGNVTGSVGSVSGNIGGNVAGSVGSISGVSFPSNFSALSISGGGAVTFGNTSIATVTTVTTTTNLTNLPAIPNDWLTAAGIASAALNGKGDWPVGKTGYSITGTITTLDALATHGDSAWATATGFATPTNIVGGTITTVTNLTNAPTNGDLTNAMKASVTTAATAATPSVTVSGTVNANIVQVHSVTVKGVGSAGDPWGPA